MSGVNRVCHPVFATSEPLKTLFGYGAGPPGLPSNQVDGKFEQKFVSENTRQQLSKLLRSEKKVFAFQKTQRCGNWTCVMSQRGADTSLIPRAGSVSTPPAATTSLT